MENQRAVSLLFIVGGVLIGVFFRSAAGAILTSKMWEDPVIAGVAPASALFGVVVGIISFFVLLGNQTAKSFTDSVVTEIKKVTWPTREETVSNTMVVIGAALFFSALLAVYDLTWAKLTALALYSGG